MTTLPPEPAPEPAAGVSRASAAPGPAARGAGAHTYRRVAEGFGGDAGRYDRARPGYPGALIGRIVAASPGPDLVDVGCGTGIAARLFAAAGCRVLGVDPDPRMAALARAGGTGTEVATFEDWDSRGRMFDAVTAAQAWHWVDPVAGAARAASVLRPGGVLAVFWNAMEPPAALEEAFGAVYRRVMPEHPIAAGFWSRPAVDTYAAGGARAAEGMRAAGGFGEPREWREPWQRDYTRQEWLDMVPTLGGHSQFPPAVIAALLDGLGEVVDAAGGGFTMSYTTLAVVAARTAG
jgi:SAM-dependent methyltransferase